MSRMTTKNCSLRLSNPSRYVSRPLAITSLSILLALGLSPALRAQSTPTPAPQQPAQPAQPAPTDTPDAGGPTGDNGPIVVPKKKTAPADDTPPPPPAPVAPKIRNPEGMPSVSLHVNVPEVTVDVGVLLEKTHQFVPNLKPANFKIFEDGK